MANGKDSFLLYHHWKSTFEGLTPEQCKELILLIFTFAMTRERGSPKDPIVNAVFSLMSGNIERDLNKYDDIVSKRIESGRKGGLVGKSK